MVTSTVARSAPTRKMSFVVSRSPSTRLSAKLSKAIQRPSAEMLGLAEAPLASPPSREVDTRTVTASKMSRTKMSLTPFPSSATNVLASLSNATNAPLPEMAGAKEPRSPTPPVVSALTSTRLPVARSRTNRSLLLLPSSGWGSLARVWNSTNLPLAERAAAAADWLPCVPSEVLLTRSMTMIFLASRPDGLNNEVTDRPCSSLID